MSDINTGASGGGGGSGDALVANPLSQFASTTSAQLASTISNETGSGLLVFNTSPTLVTPLLGTPTSGVATNLTGLPLTTGVTGVLPVANGGTGSATRVGNYRLDRQGPLGAVTGTAAMADVFTFNVPANTLGINDALRVIVHFGHTGSASVTYQWKFGATATTATTGNTGSGGASQVLIANLGATNSQTMRTLFTEFNTSTLNAIVAGAPAEDTTGIVAVSFQFNVAATDSVTPAHWLIEVIHS